MKKRIKRAILILLSLVGFAPLWAGEWDFLTVNGYGTLGGAYQDNDRVLYRDSFQASKGSQGDFSLLNYSILGLQFDAQATDQLSFTLQGSMSPNNENGALIDLQWLNAKYQVNDALYVRAGMMRMAAYMFSDILNVGYYYDWIRLPDMYGVVPYDRHKGVEFSYSFSLDDLFINTSFVYGKADSDGIIVREEGQLLDVDVRARDVRLWILKVLYDDLSFRIGYSHNKFTFYNAEAAMILSQLNAMGVPSVSEAIDHYGVENAPMRYLNIGAQYDFAESYLIGEYIDVDTDSFLPDITSWYVGAGYNFDQWTPFVLYSELENRSNYRAISTEGMSAEAARATMIANQTLSMISTLPEVEMTTLSLGVRYDAGENFLIKFQYDDHERFDEHLDVFSTSVDFVF